MADSDFLAIIGGALVAWSLGQFIGWWAIPLTLGLVFLGAAVSTDVIDETRKLHKKGK